jgi:hypothetical protein
MLRLGLSFFALSSEYRQYLIDEYFLLSKVLGTGYADYLNMPTYVRKYLVNKIIEVNTPET